LKTLRPALYEMATITHNPAQPGKLSDPVELSVIQDLSCDCGEKVRMSSPDTCYACGSQNMV